MTPRIRRQLDRLFERYEIHALVAPDMNYEQRNTIMNEIKEQAVRLQSKITDEKFQRRLQDLIKDCSQAMYSHRLYIEKEQLVILETNDSEKKYAVLHTSRLGDNCYIDAFEYDDAIKRKEAVLDR